MRIVPGLLVLIVTASCASAKSPGPTTSSSAQDSIQTLFKILPKNTSATARPQVVAKIRALYERDPKLVDQIIAIIDQRTDVEKFRLIETLGIIGPDAAEAVPKMLQVYREIHLRKRAEDPAWPIEPGSVITDALKGIGSEAVSDIEHLLREDAQSHATTLPATDDSVQALFRILHKHSSPAADPRVVAKIRELQKADPLLVDKIIADIDRREDWEKAHLIEVLGVIGPPAVKAIPTMVRVDSELMAKLRKAGVAVGNVPQLAVISMSKMGNAAVPELKRLVAEGNEVEAEAALFALAAMRKGDGVPLDVIEKKMRGATEDHKFIEYLMMASAMRSDYLRKPPADIQERLLKLAEAEPSISITAVRLIMMSDLAPEKRIERLITAGARVITLWNDPTIDPHGQWGPAGLSDVAVRGVSQTALLDELKSDDPHRRAAACAIVGFARDSSQQRINLIRPLLDDAVPVVRRAAVFATASVGGEPAKTLGAKIRELAEQDQSPEVRTEAEMALRLIEAQR